MKKEFFMSLIMAVIITGCGNKNSAAADSSADGIEDTESQMVEAKQMYAPDNISTPYSISAVPVMNVDIATITLDNSGRAHLAFRGDGASGIPTKKLRRMVALQALISSGVDREDITEKQLANFVALDDIGMTVKQWSENYRKPLAELKSINGSGILPQTDYDDNYANSIMNWLAALRVVAESVESGNAEQDYSLNPVQEIEDEETEANNLALLEELEPEEEVELPEEILNTEPLIWNSNTIPEANNLPLGFNLVIVADKACAYSHIDRLLGDVYRIHPYKFMTSQLEDSNEGGWCMSFMGAGDGWGANVRSLNNAWGGFIDENRALVMVVDNIRDSSGKPINGSEGRHRKFIARVWNGTQTADQAQEYELMDCRTDYNEGRGGLPMVLRQSNELVINAVDRLKERLHKNEITPNEYQDLVKELRDEYKYSNTPQVLIKMAPNATYEAFIAAINEMYLNHIINWRITKADPRELQQYMVNSEDVTNY